MTILLAFLSRYWMHIAAAAALVLAYGWWHHSVYQSGWDSRDVDWKADTAKREEYGRAETARLQLLNDQIESQMAVIAAQQSRKREVEYREVVKRKTIYRENPDAGKCVVPLEFLCHIDTAYEGLPESSFDTCRKDTALGRIPYDAVFLPER